MDGRRLRYELASDEEAPLLAIRRILGLERSQPLPPLSVKLGPRRGTNALLTRTGARTAFITTRGFGDVLLIGYQDRPRLFELAIHKPAPLFEEVVEIDERIDAGGHVLREPRLEVVRGQLERLQAAGIESLAICLLHSFANQTHEEQVERIAREIGFTEVSTSSRLAPLIKIVSRGDTTVVDGYLNPVLRDYVERLAESLGSGLRKLMTSAGGLVAAEHFRRQRQHLVGAGGGSDRLFARRTAGRIWQIDRLRHGGHEHRRRPFDGASKREFETQKAGVRIVAPMLAVETVAAGGGSICDFDGVKLVVGPASAGADPGPACYGRGGPLSVTDVNFFLGKLLSKHFPFPLDQHGGRRAVGVVVPHGLPTRRRDAAIFPAKLGARLHRRGQREHGPRRFARSPLPRDTIRPTYVLVPFGGAAGQHACAVARRWASVRFSCIPTPAC